MIVEIDATYPGFSERRKVESKPEGQKFAVGERVYIRPIYESSKLHFTCDVITTVEFSYEQAYGNGGAGDRYSTEIAAWYDECELMSAGDMTTDECRERLSDEFDLSYEQMIEMRNKAINSNNSRNEGLYQDFSEIVLQAFSDAMGSMVKDTKK